MGEDYEEYHVPQQSRRDKLRAHEPPQQTTTNHYQPLYYDPTATSHDLLSYGYDMMMMPNNFSLNYNMGPPPNHQPQPQPQQQHVVASSNSIYDSTNQYLLSSTHSNSNNSNNNSTSNNSSQALCLSLSSHQESCNDDHAPRVSCVPLGPFTGYASILKGSKFLKPAQQLLQELCFLGTTTDLDHPTTTPDHDPSFVHPSSFDTFIKNEDLSLPSVDGHISRLLALLDEVLRRYKQYYQQMQTVLASFETVAGLSNAAPYANLAVKAMLKHFNSTKIAISDQLAKAHSHRITKGEDEAPTAVYGQRLNQTLGLFNEYHQPVWRPQRGLPERAVSILKAWLFEHFLHPYPTDTDKVILAKRTGLSRNQVSNWFINARVRLWKPMVEEIHTLEMKQAQMTSSRDNSTNEPSDPLNSATSLASDNPSTSSNQQFQEVNPFKRNRNEYNHMHMGSDEQVSVAYNNLESHLSGTGGVSLTLGLHRNNVIGLAEPFHHITAAQRFGLGSDITSGGYVMADGYEAITRHYGRTGMGGQREFVG